MQEFERLRPQVTTLPPQALQLVAQIGEQLQQRFSALQQRGSIIAGDGRRPMMESEASSYTTDMEAFQAELAQHLDRTKQMIQSGGSSGFASAGSSGMSSGGFSQSLGSNSGRSFGAPLGGAAPPNLPPLQVPPMQNPPTSASLRPLQSPPLSARAQPAGDIPSIRSAHSIPSDTRSKAFTPTVEDVQCDDERCAPLAPLATFVKTELNTAVL